MMAEPFFRNAEERKQKLKLTKNLKPWMRKWSRCSLACIGDRTSRKIFISSSSYTKKYFHLLHMHPPPHQDYMYQKHTVITKHFNYEITLMTQRCQICPSLTVDNQHLLNVFTFENDYQ